MRAGQWQTALILALVAGLAATDMVFAEPLRLERTQSDHQGPQTVEPIEPFAPADHVYRREDVLAYRLPEAVTKWAKLDPKLSHLCRFGAFAQQRPMALYAFAPQVTYGVAFAEGANLHDPQKLAKPGSVYFFSVGETSNCLVLKAQKSQLTAYSTSKFGSPPAK